MLSGVIAELGRFCFCHGLGSGHTAKCHSLSGQRDAGEKKRRKPSQYISPNSIKDASLQDSIPSHSLLISNVSHPRSFEACSTPCLEEQRQLLVGSRNFSLRPMRHVKIMPLFQQSKHRLTAILSKHHDGPSFPPSSQPESYDQLRSYPFH